MLQSTSLENKTIINSIYIKFTTKGNDLQESSIKAYSDEEKALNNDQASHDEQFNTTEQSYIKDISPVEYTNSSNSETTSITDLHVLESKNSKKSKGKS